MKKLLFLALVSLYYTDSGMYCRNEEENNFLIQREDGWIVHYSNDENRFGSQSVVKNPQFIDKSTIQIHASITASSQSGFEQFSHFLAREKDRMILIEGPSIFIPKKKIADLESLEEKVNGENTTATLLVSKSNKELKISLHSPLSHLDLSIKNMKNELGVLYSNEIGSRVAISELHDGLIILFAKTHLFSSCKEIPKEIKEKGFHVAQPIDSEDVSISSEE